MNEREMFELARQVAYNSYSPYSNFMTGATLVTKSGKIYTGCNVENQSLQSICAEKVAMAKAISEGERDFFRGKIQQISVADGKGWSDYTGGA